MVFGIARDGRCKRVKYVVGIFSFKNTSAAAFRFHFSSNRAVDMSGVKIIVFRMVINFVAKYSRHHSRGCK